MIDSHFNEYQPTTRVKLQIISDYVSRWLPIFLQTWNGDAIGLIDVMAGPGGDGTGSDGSPLIAAKALQAYQEMAEKHGVTIRVFLNDDKPDHVSALEEKVSSLPIRDQITVTCLDYKDALTQALGEIKNGAAFVLIDQYGWSNVDTDLLASLLSKRYRDIMFFMALQFMLRDIPSGIAQRHLGDGVSQLEGQPTRTLARAYRSYLKSHLAARISGKVFVCSASLHGKTSYALMFCATHPLAAEIFVTSVDKRPSYRRDNVDDGQVNLFEERSHDDIDLDELQRSFEAFIQEKDRSNREIYEWSLEEGVDPKKFLKPVLKRLEEQGKIVVSPSIGRIVGRWSSIKSQKDSSSQPMIHWKNEPLSD